jgi:hypothetical protein
MRSNVMVLLLVQMIDDLLCLGQTLSSAIDTHWQRSLS